MRKGLLLGIAGIAAAVGTPNVRAACIPTQDCAELGYKYTSSECAGDRIACPFDTSKFFCFEPCSYTVTAADCSKQCKNVGTNACTRNGTVYYEACGASKCSRGQECNNGSCSNLISYYCCSTSYCETSHYHDCLKVYDDCSSYHSKCRSEGGRPTFVYCGGYHGSYDGYGNSGWWCDK